MLYAHQINTIFIGMDKIPFWTTKVIIQNNSIWKLFNELILWISVTQTYICL